MESPRHTCEKLVVLEPDKGTESESESEPIFVKDTWYPTHFDLSITNGLQAWTCHAREEEVKERASQWDQPVSEYIDLAEKYLGFEQPGSVYGFSDAGNGFRRLTWTFEKEGTKLEWLWKCQPSPNSKKTKADVLEENKEYKDFKDKYSVTPMKLCRIGFNMFEDSELEDHWDAISVDGESSGSSDEADEVHGTLAVKASDTTSGSKRKSSSGTQRDKKKKVSARELSFSVDRATSAAKEIAMNINTMMNSNENAGTACVEELLAT